MTLSFYIFGILTVISAIAVVSFRNTLSSAMALVVSMFCMACLFVTLDAHFLAAMQVLVYAGAIMVLFVFVIMLLNLGNDTLLKIQMTFSGLIGLFAAGYLTALLLLKLRHVPATELPEVSPLFGTLESVGEAMFTDYLIPFELTSILILVAVVGAIALAKRDPHYPNE